MAGYNPFPSPPKKSKKKRTPSPKKRIESPIGEGYRKMPNPYGPAAKGGKRTMPRPNVPSTGPAKRPAPRRVTAIGKAFGKVPRPSRRANNVRRIPNAY